MSRTVDAGAPRVVAWETTRRCNLKCVHCRASATHAQPADELTTDEARRLILEIAERCAPLLILSGGEPLMRPDLFVLARAASDADMRVVVATNGTLLDGRCVAALREAGVAGVSVSLDGPDAATHDRIRAAAGSFADALRGLGHLRAGAMPFQINFTVCAENADRLDDMVALAERQGAHTLDVFMLVPTGRARGDAVRQVTAQRYEEILRRLAERPSHARPTLRVTCAPHFQRVLRQMGRAGSPRGGGCLAGRSFVFLSHRGEVFPCGYLDVPCGDASRRGFWSVWEQSEVLKALRERRLLKGKCARCEFVEFCGGCRARAYGLAADYLAEEPLCAYQPGPPAPPG